MTLTQYCILRSYSRAWHDEDVDGAVSLAPHVAGVIAETMETMQQRANETRTKLRIIARNDVGLSGTVNSGSPTVPETGSDPE